MAFPTGSFFAGDSGAVSAGNVKAVLWPTSLTTAFFSRAAWWAAWADRIKIQVNYSQILKRQRGILETPVPAYWPFLLQTWRSFSWDPVGFPSLSGPQWYTGAKKWDEKETHQSCCYYFQKNKIWKITSGQQHSILNSFLDIGCNSYKRFYVNLLVIKGGLVLWQAQMLQHRWQILKVLAIFLVLLVRGWCADRGNIRQNRGCRLQQQGQVRVNRCNIWAKAFIYFTQQTCFVSPLILGMVDADSSWKPFFWLDNRSKRIREPEKNNTKKEFDTVQMISKVCIC